jgi:hypothetical protein
MVRPHLKYAALLLLILCACVAQAEKRSARLQSGDIVRSSTPPTAQLVDAAFARHVPTSASAVALIYTLPPEPKPTTHWPWWLRILAVIFLLVFIRIVAGSVRSKPSGPGPV